MGYFALLGESEDSLPKVVRAHINLWSLPSLIPGRRLFYFDVGVELEAGGTAVTNLQMLLPFRVEEGKWPDGSKVVQDLFEYVTHEDTSELIFGGPVTHRSDRSGHFLSIGDYSSDLRVLRIKPGKAVAVEGYVTRADSSLYNLEFDSPIEPGNRAYVRVRWRVFGAHPLWRWKHLDGGARVDLRVCDVRESRFAAVDRHLRNRILDIHQANIFLMASPKLQLAAHSPQFKYLRILEPGAWKHYLKGAHHVGSVRGLLVYYWRHGPGLDTTRSDPSGDPRGAINVDEPFRVFLDFNRSASARWWMQIARVVVGVTLALVLLKATQTVDLNRPNWDSVSWGKLLALLFGGAVVSWLSTLDKLKQIAAGFFLGPRKGLRRIERAILSLGPWH